MEIRIPLQEVSSSMKRGRPSPFFLAKSLKIFPANWFGVRDFFDMFFSFVSPPLI